MDLEYRGWRVRAGPRLEGGFERRAQVDHLAVRGPQARLHQEVALLFRRRVEQDVRDPFRRQIQVDVLRVAVRRAHLPVLELVAAFRVGLDQADDVMLANEPESAVANLHRGQEVAKVHPTVRVHLEAVPFREMSEDAGHRAAEEFDLLVVEEELAFAAAVRTELFPEIPVRTAFLEHASLPWAVGIRPRLINFRPPGRSGGPLPVRRGARAPPVAPHRSAPPVSPNPCDGCSPGWHRGVARPPDRSHARTPLPGHTPR